MIRWGLVGGSDIAATRMIPAMRALGQPISAVSSSTPQRAAAFANKHQIAVAADDVADLVNRDDVDAVYISSINALHGPHTVAAAAAGKHVLCEKPVAVDLTQAWAMVDACAAAGVVFGVNHHLPAHSTHVEVRRLVAAGAIGEPMAVRVFFAFELAERLRSWRLTDDALGGPVLDLIPHVASVVNKLVGTPLEAVAINVRQGRWGDQLAGAAEDTSMSVIRYSGDVLAQTHVGWTVPFARNGLEIHGTQGSIVALDVMRADPGGTVVLQNSSGFHEIGIAEHVDPYVATLEAYASAVAQDGEPSVSGLEALRALAVTMAVKEAGVLGQTVPVRTER